MNRIQAGQVAGASAVAGSRPGLQGAVRLLVLVASFLAPLLLYSTGGHTQAGPEQQLADRYAPVIVLKAQSKACDKDGEAYRPVPADVVLDREGVMLRGPDGEVVAEAPGASDLYGRDDGYYLDFPGNSLHPGCSYEEWFQEIAAGVPTTVYAHVIVETGARWPAGAAILAVLAVQRLEQQARVGLGDDPADLIEERAAGDALRRSKELVRGADLRTFTVAATVNAAVFAAGPIVGILALLIWSPSIFVVNLISALLYSLLLPYAGIVLTLLFYDLRRRHAERGQVAGLPPAAGPRGQSGLMFWLSRKKFFGSYFFFTSTSRA